MTERDAFLRAIAENMYDDTPRLAFADWLDERGEHDQPHLAGRTRSIGAEWGSDRAEFIRVQVELEPIRDKYEIPRAGELHAREEKFGSRGTRQYHAAREWLGDMPKEWDDWRTGAAIEYRRGFPDTLSLPVRTFLEIGTQIRELHPTIRRVVLFRVNGYGERLAACQALEGLCELELACWYSWHDAQAIANSPHLKELQVLELWLGRRNGPGDELLCDLVANARAWPKLRELVLLDPDGERREAGLALAASLDAVLGGKLARYERGYPELFPFAADYYYVFPGYLPDGRRALAAEDETTDPPTLRVLTFDSGGNQTPETFTVPAPPPLVSIPHREWYKHNDHEQWTQQLAEYLGFRPGFIRIRDCQFGLCDEHDYNRPFPEVAEDSIGILDVDTQESWEGTTGPEGHGGRVWRAVRNGEYVFGWDRYADKRGQVHST